MHCHTTLDSPVCRQACKSIGGFAETRKYVACINANCSYTSSTVCHLHCHHHHLIHTAPNKCCYSVPHSTRIQTKSLIKHTNEPQSSAQPCTRTISSSAQPCTHTHTISSSAQPNTHTFTQSLH